MAHIDALAQHIHNQNKRISWLKDALDAAEERAAHSEERCREADGSRYA